MIEAVLIFALGALVATFVWLLMLRAVWSRAVRLTTKRVQASLPLSLDEIKAERDQVRAEMAMQIAKAESQGARHAEKANLLAIDLGRANEHGTDLTRTIAARDSTIAELTQDGARKADRIDHLEQGLAAEKAAHAETNETLAARIDEVQHLTGELGRKQADLTEQGNALVALKAELDSFRHDKARLETDLAFTQDRLTLVQGQFNDNSQLLARERIDSAALREAHKTLITEHNVQSEALKKATEQMFELQQALGESRKALGDAKAEASAMVAEKERLAAETMRMMRDLHAVDAEKAALQAERDEKIKTLFAAKTALESLKLSHETLTERHKGLEAAYEQQKTLLRDAEGALQREITRAADMVAMRSQSETMRSTDRQSAANDMQKADQLVGSLRQEMETLRAEKNRLSGALAAAREERDSLRLKTTAPSGRDSKAALRAKIEDIGAEMAYYTMVQEGPSSPIRAMLSKAGEAPAPARSRRKTLVERINDLDKPLS